MRRFRENSSSSDRSLDLEDEKSSSELFELRRVHQNLEDEKSSSELFEFGQVIRPGV
jgi:hypothetical protein